jgi:hypothetical protein
MDDNPTDHLEDGDSVGFSDQKEHVPVVWPHSQEETFSEALLDAGLNPLDVVLAAKVHEEFLTRFSNRRGAEVVRMILARIAETKTGKTAEYKAIIAILSPEKSLEEIAAEAGMSRQKLHFHVKKLRPILTPSAFIGGDDAPAE